jgi:signal transduction histidine kinase
MSASAEKVLLVDDDESALRLMKRVVEGMGLTARAVSSREQATAALRREDFGVVVTDVRLETGDAGVRLAREVGLLRPGLPVVLVTGSPELETALPALRLHAFDYLAKPYSLEALRRTVRRALSSRRAEEPRRREIRDELSAAYTQLKKLERTREGMVAVLNHELRTPMCVVKAAAEQIANESCSEDGAAARRLLGQGLERLERTVTDILLHAELAGGAPASRGDAVDLMDLAEEAAASFSEEAAALEVRIDVRREDGSRPAPGDRDLLARAVTHLIGNAVRFNRPGGRVLVVAGGTNESRTLTVSDEGGGIPPDELKRVFDPYYQIADYMTRRTGGLGLGLAIVRAVFEGHGGGVTAVNRPDLGCEFRARMSVSPPGEAS